jgi:hypothetical protein
MHPYSMELLIRQRVADLHKSARRYSSPMPGWRRPRNCSVGYRAGWALVEIGLALARGPRKGTA